MGICFLAETNSGENVFGSRKPPSPSRHAAKLLLQLACEITPELCR